MGTQDFPRSMPNHEIRSNAKVLVGQISLSWRNVVNSATLKRHFLPS